MKPDKAKVCIFFTMAALLLFSCQNEEVNVKEDGSQNIITGSVLAEQMLRIAQNPMSYDNILDSTSCFSVKLPVQVLVNGEAVTIEGETDFELIEDIFEQSSTDEDEVTHQFPVTVVYTDYTEQIIENNAEWLEAAACISAAYTGLDCINFKYPLSINLYDITNQIADVAVMENDIELYGFLNNMQENILAEIAFPVVVITPEGNEVRCNNNEVLLSVIDQYAPLCSAVGGD